MGQPGVFRKGWENEHLAAFVLSRFAFIAQPVKIGDDLGADFFCTFFERRGAGRAERLIPTGSFAIQVKSARAPKDYTTQIEYLSMLELPFFVGVVDDEQRHLDVYSGEYLPFLFAHKGKGGIKKLSLSYCENNVSPASYFDNRRKGTYTLKCPKIARFTVGMKSDTVARNGEKLRKIAKRVHRNIAAKTSEEHVYELGPNGESVCILAGPGSEKIFRDNFKKRLAEALANLERLCKIDRGDLDECRFYLNIYDDLRQREDSVPRYLTQLGKNLRALIENGGS